MVRFALRDVPPGRYTLAIDARDQKTGAVASASESFSLLAMRR